VPGPDHTSRNEVDPNQCEGGELAPGMRLRLHPPEAKGKAPQVEAPTRGSAPGPDGELRAIAARSNAATAKLTLTDRKSVQQVNTELTSVHAAFIAYAKAHGLTVTSKTYTHKLQPGAGLSSGGTK
jgi:hypothetical protein